MMNLTRLPKSNIEFFNELTPSHSQYLLNKEKEYVIERLKCQSVVGGWWILNGKPQRRLTRDENIAYYSL